MVKTKCYYEENRPLLVLALDSEKFRITDPVCEAAVTRGAVNYLGRWPAHVFAAFIAGCLVFATFVIFAIISAILTIPSGEKCRMSRNIDANLLPNLYFVKHENRTWSQQELCYIETAAKNYKNLSIYLINLLSDNEKTEENSSEIVRIKLLDERNQVNEYRGPISVDVSNWNDKSVIRRIKSGEKQGREKLAAFNANIKNIDVPIRRFFNGSRLATVYNYLSQGMTEMAAKAYVLWNFPGVALDPAIYPRLELFSEYLRSNDPNNNGCGKAGTATVQANGDIQASSVPCQAFLDNLIREIATNELPDRERTLRKAMIDFCPRPSRCQGVRILNDVVPRPEVSKEKLNCPTIYS